MSVALMVGRYELVNFDDGVLLAIGLAAGEGNVETIDDG